MGDQVGGLGHGVLGDQHQPFALLLVVQRDHGMAGVGPEDSDHILDRPQRDHLAADLGEALGPAQDLHPAILTDRDDVAGVVPAAVEALGAPIGAEIAAHYVRPLQQQPPATRDTFHRLQPRLDPRQELADAALAVVFRLVEGHRRRSLGDAIALDQGHPETLLDQGVGLGAHPLGPADNELQARQVLRLRGAGVLVHEGVGGEEHAGLGLAHQAGDDLGVQR